MTVGSEKGTIGGGSPNAKIQPEMSPTRRKDGARVMRTNGPGRGTERKGSNILYIGTWLTREIIKERTGRSKERVQDTTISGTVISDPAVIRRCIQDTACLWYTTTNIAVSGTAVIKYSHFRRSYLTKYSCPRYNHKYSHLIYNDISHLIYSHLRHSYLRCRQVRLRQYKSVEEAGAVA